MSILKKIWNPYRIKDLTSIERSKTFCIMPWVHFHITQYGTVTPCCQAPWQEDKAFGNINKQSMDEIWNSPEIKLFRKTIIEGNVDKRCESCFVREKSGFTSLRQITNKKYGHKLSLLKQTLKNGTLKDANPIYLDIRFSNVCNLKCRICGPWSSSNWHSDALEMGMVSEKDKALTYSINDNTQFFESLNRYLDEIEEIYFAGGEPLMMEEHYQMLEELIKHNKTDVKLTYNTNFSVLSYKHYDIISLWKNFKHINIAASLDAEGERGEYVRKNLDWKNVVMNRQRILKELPFIEFMVSPTISIYNLLHLADFHKNWVQEKLIRVEDFIPTLLIQPKQLSVHILPKDFKLKAIKIYKEHIEWIKQFEFEHKEKGLHMLQQFENVIKVLQSTMEQSEKQLFVEWTNKLDKIRKEQTFLIFPELKALVS